MSMMPLTAAIIVPNRTLWEQAHSCIQNLPIRIAVEENDPEQSDALLDRIEKHRVDVVLVEANRFALPLEEFVQRLHNTPAQPAVFVLHTEPSPQLILEALRAGVNEFLYTPLAEPLRAAFERLSETRSKGAAGTAHALGKIFGFVSSRGGCGATTFAAHAAASLVRQTKQPLLLADFDFEAGLLRFLMKSKSAWSVRDALDNLHRMDSSLWKGLISACQNQIDFIPAPEELAARRSPEPEQMMHLTRFIRSMYPLAVVDFGRCFSASALDSLPELEVLYLVLTPDLSALDHAKQALQILDERGCARTRIKVLVNRMPQRGGPDPKAIERYLDHPVSGTFASDFMGFYDAYSEGHLLDSASKLGKQFNDLATAIRARAAGQEEKEARQEQRQEKKKEAPKPEPEGSKRWFSFWNKALA
jgi:pilus assembly protein CpaE